MDNLLSGTDFGQLRAFVLVANARSFSRAAESLGVSSSALSQTIRGLEERLGVRLLNRTTRSVSPTEAGELLLRRVSPAIEELAVAMGQAERYREKIAGVVRIHAFRTAADLFLKPMLRSFGEACPDVVLDDTLDDEVVDVVAGGYDAAIRIGEVIERDMIAVRLGPDLRQIAVASPEYLARYGAPGNPRELTTHRCIGWRWEGHELPYKWEFNSDRKWFEVEVKGPLICNSKEFCLKAAAAGLGIAFATQELIAPYLEQGTLVPLLESWSAPFPGFYLCYPAQRQMAPALRAFIDAVKKTAPPSGQPKG
jgi:DNA-binding transcriptional LysR family regulator